MTKDENLFESFLKRIEGRKGFCVIFYLEFVGVGFALKRKDSSPFQLAGSDGDGDIYGASRRR